MSFDSLTGLRILVACGHCQYRGGTVAFGLSLAIGSEAFPSFRTCRRGNYASTESLQYISAKVEHLSKMPAALTFVSIISTEQNVPTEHIEPTQTL